MKQDPHLGCEQLCLLEGNLAGRTAVTYKEDNNIGCCIQFLKVIHWMYSLKISEFVIESLENIFSVIKAGAYDFK